MNDAQRLWWTQANSDHEIFLHLRRAGNHPCHLLHYLQMSTEKLSKAYLWGSGSAPPKKHTGFVQFLRALNTIQTEDLERISKVLTFKRRQDFEKWIKNVLPLAYALENVVPTKAADGPNPEYPWPHSSPIECPSEYRFPLWDELAETGQGRRLLEFIGIAVARFDQYA